MNESTPELISLSNDFDASNTTSLPLHINDTFALFSTSMHCTLQTKPPISFESFAQGQLQISADVDIGLGIVASGTLVPPKFNEFMVFASKSR